MTPEQLGAYHYFVGMAEVLAACGVIAWIVVLIGTLRALRETGFGACPRDAARLTQGGSTDVGSGGRGEEPTLSASIGRHVVR